MSERITQVSNNSGLITATIKQKQQTFHLVTEETLSSLKEKSITSDILMLVTSLLFGAFFSVLITINASTGISDDTLKSLNIYKFVFLGFGALFLIMTIVSFVMSTKLVKGITSNKATLSSGDDES